MFGVRKHSQPPQTRQYLYIITELLFVLFPFLSILLPSGW